MGIISILFAFSSLVQVSGMGSVSRMRNLILTSASLSTSVFFSFWATPKMRRRLKSSPIKILSAWLLRLRRRSQPLKILIGADVLPNLNSLTAAQIRKNVGCVTMNSLQVTYASRCGAGILLGLVSFTRILLGSDAQRYVQKRNGARFVCFASSSLKDSLLCMRVWSLRVFPLREKPVRAF